MKLLYLIVILVICTFFQTAYLHEKGEDLAIRTNNQKCHYDIVHENLPDLSKYYYLYDYMILIFLAPLVFYYGSYDLFGFVISLAWLVVPIFIFRCFTTVSTVPTRTTNDIVRDFGSWIKRHICGSENDLLLSGHICFALSVILVMLEFGITSNRTLWLTLLGAYGLFSSTSRSHFTVDILLAVPVTLAFYDFTKCKSASKDLLFGGCP
jgi:hypothetical protein